MTARRSRELPTVQESLVRLGQAALLLRPYWASYAGLMGLGLGLGAIGLVGPQVRALLGTIAGPGPATFAGARPHPSGESVP